MSPAIWPLMVGQLRLALVSPLATVVMADASLPSNTPLSLKSTQPTR